MAERNIVLPQMTLVQKCQVGRKIEPHSRGLTLKLVNLIGRQTHLCMGNHADIICRSILKSQRSRCLINRRRAAERSR